MKASIISMLLLFFISMQGLSQQRLAKAEYNRKQQMVAIYSILPHGGGSGCSGHKVTSGLVTEVKYSGEELYKFTLKLQNGRRQEFSINTDNISRPDMGWIYTLIAEGKRLRVSYYVCGSGGFSFADDVESLAPHNTPQKRSRSSAPDEESANAETNENNSDVQIEPVEPSRPARVWRRNLILFGDYQVLARQYISYRFFVPADCSAELRGEFKGFGANGDVDFYVVDYQGYEDYANGKRYSAYISESRTTLKRFNVALGSGEYYIIFSNGFSLYSNKVVRTRIELVLYK
jgi:hypothetical protein